MRVVYSRTAIFFSCALMVWAHLPYALASVPELIPVGGVMTDRDGVAIEGPYDVVFSIYASQNTGTPLWQEHRVGAHQLRFNDGLFSAYLGEVVPLNFLELLAYEALWLGIRVGQDSEMNRVKIGAVPFALAAQRCREVVDTRCDNSEYLQGWDPDTGTPICTPVYYSAIDNLPPDIADGDNDTRYSAGTGLNLNALTFSVDQTTIEIWANGVCYDAPGELTTALDDTYVNEQQGASITNEMLVGNIAATKIAGTAWTAENDGEGSGLNADLLDGYSESDFAHFDHHHDEDYLSQYKRTIVVSPVGDGADTVANGDALLSALAGIADASEANPYLIKLEPGVYELADEGQMVPLRMKDWVDIEGSGENATKITSSGAGSNDLATVLFLKTGTEPLNSQLRSVTVENTGGPSLKYSVAIIFEDATASASIRNVTLITHTVESYSRAILARNSSGLHLSHFSAKVLCTEESANVGCYGMWLSQGGAVTVSDAEIYVSIDSGSQANGIRVTETTAVVIKDTSIEMICGGGPLKFGLRGVRAGQDEGSARLDRVDISAHCESEQVRALDVKPNVAVRVTNSTLKATGSSDVFGIYAQENDTLLETNKIKVFNTTIVSDGPVVRNEANREMYIVGDSVMEGGATEDEGTLTCLNVYDDTLQFYPDTCPN